MQPAADDVELLQRCAHGDAAAFGQLSRRHAPRVLALARRMLGSEADAQDVVQEAFIRLWQQAPRWEWRDAQLSTWLHRVATNLCLNHIQRVQQRVQPMGEEQEDIADTADTGEVLLEAQQRAEAVQRAIAQLPERQRAAVALFYAAGASTAQTAEALGLSVKAAESLLVRARQSLRQRLSPWMEV